MSHARTIGCLVACAAMLSACGHSARYDVNQGTGPTPVLPQPTQSLIPTIRMAKAVGWAEGELPVAAAGLRVQRFADGLEHPRWLHVLPNGDVLVAESNAPTQSVGGIRGWFMRRLKKRAGGAVPSPDRITWLRDADGDGIAERRATLLDSLQSPFGMALVGDDLFVATTGAIVRHRYATGDSVITGPGTVLATLPSGPINHHWTKSLIASPDGRYLFVGVGSNSDHAERGMQHEVGRAAVWRVETATGTGGVFASGLRNPVGLAWHPGTGALWVAVNERDELGSDLVPDYLTRVREGAFYGWPYSYYGGHLDERVRPQDPSLVQTAQVPDYALGPHTASLGLAWATDSLLPAPYRDGMFVGQHGSWNRKPVSGYRVVFVPFRSGEPFGTPIDVLSGFVNDNGHARGRPVGVSVHPSGALLVADDVGKSIWRVSAAR
jgi:glucose/arabinose dehydrogenase